MRTPLFVLGLAVLAGCSATTAITFSGSSSSSSSGSGTGGTGASGSTTSSGSTGSASSGSGAGTSSASTGNGGSTGAGAGAGGGITFDAGTIPDAGTTATAEVYGQSATTLYKLDPLTKVVTTVGDFQGCGDDGVIDIALNKSGQMWATTFSGVFTVDPATAACTNIASGDYPNSLSFVPAGTLDPNVEALVGYNGADYVRIDLTSGAVTTVGSLGNQGYASSGDVVSVIGGGTYLTVTGGPQDCGDCIVEVDPATGALMNFIGPVGHAEVYGLAYWGGSAYGFDDAGELFEIDLTTGNSTTIVIPNAPSDLSFYGAGSTTLAPLTTN